MGDGDGRTGSHQGPSSRMNLASSSFLRLSVLAEIPAKAEGVDEAMQRLLNTLEVPLSTV